MAKAERENAMARCAWPLLWLTGALQVWLGLSMVAYLFIGVLNPASALGGWVPATTGALQAAAAAASFVPAARSDLRGAALLVAASIMLGWFSALPSVAEQGIDLRSDGGLGAIGFVLSPLTAILGASLAWRNPHPIAAALILSATTIAGILFTIALAMAIALYGF